MVFRYLAFAPLSFALNVLTYPLAPLLALLSMIVGPVLPWPFSLFHTHDDDLDGGQHQLGWPKAHGAELWLQRTKWICRNPAYGFDAFVFGFPALGVKVLKDERTGAWDGTTNNRQYVLMQTADGRKFFGYRRDILLTKRRYLKLWFGWSHFTNGTGRHLLKVDFNPFKTRR